MALELDFESIIFDYIDELKFLFFPGQWSTIFLDYSKNEILVLLFLHKKKTANMTEIAEYICAPLNTATGVVNRLEKKKIVERIRGNEDRRIVNIVLTEAAEELMLEEKRQIVAYIKEIYSSLNDNEKTVGMSIVNKVMRILRNGPNRDNSNESTTKKVKRITIE